MEQAKIQTMGKAANSLRADLSLLPPEDGALILKILKRQISRRCSAVVAAEGPADFLLEFRLAPSLAPEAYALESDREKGVTRIAAADKRGLLYGLGKVLRECRYEEAGGVFPGFSSGSSRPEMRMRCIYFATHFGNFYDQAPPEIIENYLEDLALWGCNAVKVWFDMHRYTGMEDPAAIRQVRRLRHILGYAEKLGMAPILGGLSNEAFAESPVPLRADWTSGHDGYRHDLAGHYHVELCPNKPGALDLLGKWRRSVLKAFAGIGIQYVQICHYDQGGCTCSACAPWGINGGILADREYAKAVREVFPRAKIIFSLWRYDIFVSGEWEGIFKILETPQDFADVLVISLGDLDKVKNRTPGNLPVCSFPEISMCGITPWGGYGANPVPGEFFAFWQQGRKILSGFMAYSEGIYEDFNKVLCLQLGWDSSRKPEEILEEYFSFHFGARGGEEFRKVVEILEKNLRHDALIEQNGKEYSAYMLKAVKPSEPWTLRHRVKFPADPEEAANLLCTLEQRLPAWARSSWRWKLFRIRGELDKELARQEGKSTEKAEGYFRELEKIYFLDLEQTIPALTPPNGETWKKKVEMNSDRDGVL